MMIAALVVALMSLGQPGRAAALKDLLAGNAVPQTLQLKDLGSGWWRMSLNQSGTGGLDTLYMVFLGGGGTGAYYTQGETTTLGGETYLICYRVQGKPMDYEKLMQSGPSPPKPEKLTPETKLSLSLLNLRSVVGFDDIRPFNLEQEIAASAAVAKEEPTGVSLSNLKQLALAVLMCAQDYDETLPQLKDAAIVEKTLKPYVRDEKLFTNPITNKPYMANAILSGKKLVHISNPSKMVLLYEDSPAPDGMRGVAFLDGHASRVSASEWEALKKSSKIP